MADFLSVTASVAGGGLAGLGSFQSVRAFWTARLLGATGPTPLADLAEGLQEVRGTALAEGVVTAPMSTRSCMYWRLFVEQQRRTQWETVLERREWVTFWVDDGTGRVRVEAAGAEVVVATPARVRTGVFEYPGSEWAALVARLGEPDAAPAAPFLRWREECLEPGDVVTVVGRANRTPEGWWIGPDEAAFMVSDRDDHEVVRHHRRLGQRWFAAALAGAAAGGWGVMGLF